MDSTSPPPGARQSLQSINSATRILAPEAAMLATGLAPMLMAPSPSPSTKRLLVGAAGGSYSTSLSSRRPAPGALPVARLELLPGLEQERSVAATGGGSVLTALRPTARQQQRSPPPGDEHGASANPASGSRSGSSGREAAGCATGGAAGGTAAVASPPRLGPVAGSSRRRAASRSELALAVMSPSRRALLLLAPPPAPPPPPPPPMAAQQYAATALIQRLWSSSPMSGKGRGSIADADAPSPSRNELGEPASSWWLEPAPPLPDAPPLPGAVQGAARRRGVSGSWAGGDEGGAGLAGLTTSPRRFDRAMTTSAPRGLSTKVALGPALGSDLPMLPALSLGPGQPWGAARQGSRFASSGQVYAYVAEASRPGSAPGSPRAGPGPRDVDDTEARALAAATAAAQRVKGRAQPKRCLVGEPGRRPHPEPVFLEGSMQLLRVQDSWLQPVFLADGQVRMPREYRSLLEDSAASASGWCGGAEAAAADDVFLTKTALEVGREERERAAPAAAAEAGCNADVRGAQAEVVAKAACNVREFDPSSVLPALVGLSHGQRAGGDEERQRLGDAGARAGLRSFGSCDAGWD